MPARGGVMRWDAAVVLAGGRSLRMGKEKAILEAQGRTLIEHAFEALALRFERLSVSVGIAGPSPGLKAAIERSSRRLGREIGIVLDRVEGRGPLGGIEAALEAFSGQAAFFIAVDVPRVSFPLVRALWEEAHSEGSIGCLPRWSRGLEPTYAVYSKGLLPAVERFLHSGGGSLQALAEVEGVRVLDLEKEEVLHRVFGPKRPSLPLVFANLNTPGEYEEWRRELIR